MTQALSNSTECAPGKILFRRQHLIVILALATIVLLIFQQNKNAEALESGPDIYEASQLESANFVWELNRKRTFGGINKLNMKKRTSSYSCDCLRDWLQALEYGYFAPTTIDMIADSRCSSALASLQFLSASQCVNLAESAKLKANRIPLSVIPATVFDFGDNEFKEVSVADLKDIVEDRNLDHELRLELDHSILIIRSLIGNMSLKSNNRASEDLLVSVTFAVKGGSYFHQFYALVSRDCKTQKLSWQNYDVRYP